MSESRICLFLPIFHGQIPPHFPASVSSPGEEVTVSAVHSGEEGKGVAAHVALRIEERGGLDEIPSTRQVRDTNANC